MSRLGYAAQAVSAGYYIFPCNPPGTVCPETGRNIEKEPHLIRQGQPYKLKWGDVATNSMTRVVDWWTKSPDANIGVACRPSGLLVVDGDMPKQPRQLEGTPWGYLHDRFGDLVDGADVFREMAERFGDDWQRLNDTYRVTTGSLGCHWYFRWPDGVMASQASPVPGLLDVRTNGGTRGGYVLAAGSVTSKGPYVSENDLPVADAPPWLVELCREKPRQAKVKPLFSNGSGGGGYSGLVDTVRLAHEGNRNNALLWAARSMCEDGATEEECVDTLGPAGQEAGQAERDVLSTIRSAYKIQGAKV